MVPDELTPSHVESAPPELAGVDVRPDGGGAKPVAEVYKPEDRVLTRVPGHLFLDTNPNQADVWVDGVLRGKTPVDLMVGPGSHRVVVIKAGYRMLLAVFDTTRGQFARRGLQRAGFASLGNALLEVSAVSHRTSSLGNALLEVRCETADRFPIVFDGEETGLLCGVNLLRVSPGKHQVGIFVPAKRAVAAVEVTVSRGPQPKRVRLKE